MNSTSQPQAYLPQREPKLGHPTAAWVIGTFGFVFGLIPLLFFVSVPAGAVALGLGLGARRAGKPHGVKKGRGGIVLGTLALLLGLGSLVTVVRAFDQFDEDLTCIDEAGTVREVEAC